MDLYIYSLGMEERGSCLKFFHWFMGLLLDLLLLFLLFRHATWLKWTSGDCQSLVRIASLFPFICNGGSQSLSHEGRGNRKAVDCRAIL